MVLRVSAIAQSVVRLSSFEAAYVGRCAFSEFTAYYIVSMLYCSHKERSHNRRLLRTNSLNGST